MVGPSFCVPCSSRPAPYCPTISSLLPACALSSAQKTSFPSSLVSARVRAQAAPTRLCKGHKSQNRRWLRVGRKQGNGRRGRCIDSVSLHALSHTERYINTTQRTQRAAWAHGLPLNPPSVCSAGSLFYFTWLKSFPGSLRYIGIYYTGKIQQVCCFCRSIRPCASSVDDVGLTF